MTTLVHFLPATLRYRNDAKESFMEFQHYELGNVNVGSVVEVTLSGNSANVKLMDTGNFNAYKTGRVHNYYGGHVTSSPFKISIPSSGFWHLTVDLGGYAGKVQIGVRILAS